MDGAREEEARDVLPAAPAFAAAIAAAKPAVLQAKVLFGATVQVDVQILRMGRLVVQDQDVAVAPRPVVLVEGAVPPAACGRAESRRFEAKIAEKRRVALRRGDIGQSEHDNGVAP